MCIRDSTVPRESRLSAQPLSGPQEGGSRPTEESEGQLFHAGGTVCPLTSVAAWLIHGVEAGLQTCSVL